MDFMVKHYTDTVIHSVDKIIRGVKYELKQKIDKLNIGITGEQFIVLDAIAANPKVYLQKLSEIIFKDKSNTTRIINLLEKKNLIKREMGRKNNRLVNYLSVTEYGQKIVDDNMPKIKEFVEEIFSNITNNEVELLHSLSKKVQSDLSKMQFT